MDMRCATAYPASPMTCAKLAENVKSLMSADTIMLADTGSPALEEPTQIKGDE